MIRALRVRMGPGPWLLAALCFMAFQAPLAQADSVDSSLQSGPGPGAVAFDEVLLRPLGLLSMVVGAGFFVAALPFTYATGQVGTAKEILIDTPFEDAVDRPLGRI